MSRAVRWVLVALLAGGVTTRAEAEIDPTTAARVTTATAALAPWRAPAPREVGSAAPEPAPVLATRTATAPDPRFTWVEDTYPAPTVFIFLEMELDVAVGSASFEPSASSYLSTLRVDGGWTVAPDLELGLGLSFGQAWVHSGVCPGACRFASQASTDLGDVVLFAEHARLVEWAGWVVSGRLELRAPTSRPARAIDMVTAAGLDLAVERDLGGVRPRLVVYGDGFLSLADRVDARATGESGLTAGRCRQLRDTRCVLLTGFIPAWRVGGELSATIELIGDVEAVVALGYGHSDPRDSGGPSVRYASDPGQPDGLTTASSRLELAYRASHGFRLALGLATAQPALTDSGHVRFPLWDVVDAADDRSALYAAVGWGI